MARMITYRQKAVSDFSSLVHGFSDAALASPFRSTVPFLAYWKIASGKLSDLATLLNIKLAEPVRLAFEYAVPVQQGIGKASFTDLMLVTPTQAIAVEAKYTEPEYESVSEWLDVPETYNRQQVLRGWLGLINRVTDVDLQPEDVSDCTYQLIHRTASACYPQVEARVVVYQCFDVSGDQAVYYRNQLMYLNRLLRKSERLTFYLLTIPLKKSKQYQELQASWKAGNRNLSRAIKQGLTAGTLTDFNTATIERI